MFKRKKLNIIYIYNIVIVIVFVMFGLLSWYLFIYKCDNVILLIIFVYDKIWIFDICKWCL